MGVNVERPLASNVTSSSSSIPARDDSHASPELLPTNGNRSTVTFPANSVPCSQSESHPPLFEGRIPEETAPPSQPACPPSPAATEIDDQIQVKGIKIRDFAYPSATGPSAPHLAPVPEIFDQFKGLAEVEYRWTQSYRTYPVQGRTLSRLIDMGWIGQEELSSRAVPMDLEELRKHNSRQPIYPWKPLPWTTMPTMEERNEQMQARAPYLRHWDRIRAEGEFQEMRKLKLERETEEAMERIRERERREEMALSQAKGNKRWSEANHEDANNMSTEPKKRRLSKDPENLYPAFLIPSKQYPAPLHAYNPKIYPEVAYDIAFPQSQPQSIVPLRADTPPLSDTENKKCPPGRLGRQLGRTQTYLRL